MPLLLSDPDFVRCFQSARYWPVRAGVREGKESRHHQNFKAEEFSSDREDSQHVEQHEFKLQLTGGETLLKVTFTATLSEAFCTSHT